MTTVGMWKSRTNWIFETEALETKRWDNESEKQLLMDKLAKSRSLYSNRRSQSKMLITQSQQAQSIFFVFVMIITLDGDYTVCSLVLTSSILIFSRLPIPVSAAPVLCRPLWPLASCLTCHTHVQAQGIQELHTRPLTTGGRVRMGR